MRAEGDVVLVYYEDQPAVYARLEQVEPDVKKGWYQATFLLLTIPPQQVTWILREEYVDGGAFTMGGKAMRLESVPRLPVPADDAGSQDPEEDRPAGGQGTVIPFRPRQ